MTNFLYVGIGGFIGTSLRYGISLLWVRYFSTVLPYGTLIANTIASILIGAIMEGSLSLWPIPPAIKLMLITGLLGGLSTFSTFSYETLQLFTDHYFLGILNIILNFVLALCGVIIGKYLIQFML